MTKAVMVKCYLLCLLTLALCCACGLVWADSPKASDVLIKPSTVGVPSLVRRAIPVSDDWLDYDDEVNELEETDENDESEIGGPASVGPVGKQKPKRLERKDKDKLQGVPLEKDGDAEKTKTEMVSPERQGNEQRDVATPELTRGEPSSLLSETPHTQPTQPALPPSPATDREPPGNAVDRPSAPSGQNPATHSSDSNNYDHSAASSSEPPNNAVAPSSTASTTSITPTEGRETAPAGDSQAGDSTPEESGAIQPSSTSSLTNESAAGSENAITGSGSTPEGGESTSNPANEESTTTTTTTTTTTLSPELTNNKKGDADSSSSISSSVWVRVPLLIVVTLACILVC
ncbi:uncharacterized protein TM35_000731040 [Trypanosoma theileri]|uniref:Mucin-associated surface protein (MASP) n=1 Tax=Trypanosoma theileri TaxID=67003 RepID=A0A1X0NH31_9TRYP|nr:uncharacterized protein TM35_000731040 [Trypanosoma theileri]ORC83380.1 hypothetical protein TM35_000731040 [Trypanosoma theileri]